MSSKINIDKNKPYNIKNYFNVTTRSKNTFSKTFKTTSKFSKENSDLIKFDFKRSVFEAKNFHQYDMFLSNDVQNRSTSKKLMAQTFNYNKSKNNIMGENPQKLSEDFFKNTSKKLKIDKNSSKILLNGKANYTIENNKYNNANANINDKDINKYNDNPCYFTYNSKRGNIQNFTNLTRRRHYVKLKYEKLLILLKA